MGCEVEYTHEFGEWYERLSEAEQDSVDRVVRLLQMNGIALGHPYSSGVQTSRHGHMRELRIKAGSRPLRVLYAFNPLRTAILLLGGDKGDADRRWYETNIPKADAIYDQHLEELKREEKKKK
jgi:hypothetical protein